jgi:hypothetical protein
LLNLDNWFRKNELQWSKKGETSFLIFTGEITLTWNKNCDNFHISKENHEEQHGTRKEDNMRKTFGIVAVLCFLLHGIAVAGQGGFIRMTDEEAARVMRAPQPTYSALAGSRGTVRIFGTYTSDDIYGDPWPYFDAYQNVYAVHMVEITQDSFINFRVRISGPERGAWEMGWQFFEAGLWWFWYQGTPTIPGIYNFRGILTASQGGRANGKCSVRILSPAP